MTSGKIITARTRFAKDAVSGLSGYTERIEEAFASVPRERFLGRGPWLKLTFDGYEETSSDDPVEVYQQSALAIDPDLGINNGEPQLHAKMITAVSPQLGEAIAHIGLTFL